MMTHDILQPARNLVAAVLLVLSAALAAAQNPSTTLQGGTTLPLKPQILGFNTKACVDNGQSLTVTGRYFGSQIGRGIALAGHGVHVDLPVNSWGSTTITTRIPDDARIQDGRSYYIGIETARHSQWLSNINQRITICSGQAASGSGTLIGLPPLSPIPPGGGLRTNNRGGPSPDDEGTKEETQAADFTPGGGGSLLGRGLPPAPQQREELAASDKPDDFEPAEVVAVTSGIEEAQVLAQELISHNISVKRRHPLKNLGLVISVLRIPPEYGVAPTVDSLRNAYSGLWVDVNHRYRLLGTGVDSKRYAQRMLNWPSSAAGCGAGARIGLVDSAIEQSHPALRGQRIETRSFLSAGIEQSPADHGTAIAALLVGSPNHREYTGLLPAAELYAANVFRLRDRSNVDTTSELIVRALDWLAGQGVKVINLSLGGPRDVVVELALQQVLDRGIAVVAAAGHTGKDGTPVYPAAQAGVLAITAVDANSRPYGKASQGGYIDFTAPGVDVWTATPEGAGKYRSGTSFAAPFVAAVLSNGQLTADFSLENLQQGAVDLGVPGKDAVFGWGLVQYKMGCP